MSIKKIKFQRNDHPTCESCAITMDEFEQGQIITMLPCKHIFNNEAIEEWITKENASCPVCRFKLFSLEIIEYVPVNKYSDYNYLLEHFINAKNLDIDDISRGDLVIIYNTLALNSRSNNNMPSFITDDEDLYKAVEYCY